MCIFLLGQADIYVSKEMSKEEYASQYYSAPYEDVDEVVEVVVD